MNIVTPTTYLTQAAKDQLNVAQDVINQHIVDCAACGTNKFCFDRIEAERVFVQFGRLPRRTPGLTGASVSASSFNAFGKGVEA